MGAGGADAMNSTSPSSASFSEPALSTFQRILLGGIRVSMLLVGLTCAPVHVLCYGTSCNQPKGTRAMLAKMAAADEFDFVIHNGDVSYADHQIGKKTDWSYNDWMNVYYANISVRSFCVIRLGCALHTC